MVNNILIIQTAFIGDVVLATGIVEQLHEAYPLANISILVRKGNEAMFNQHPFLHQVLVWDKKNNKYKNLIGIIKQVRKQKYDAVINVQRFAATGIITALSGAKYKACFNKNPLSFMCNQVVKHIVSTQQNPLHEVERNQTLINFLVNKKACKPKLYPTPTDFEKVQPLKQIPYICIAPASVWYTKQYPIHKWVELIHHLSKEIKIYLLGGGTDYALCNEIMQQCNQSNVENLAGQLSFLQSAALQKNAVMNYVNDSAPMHFASAVNAPTTAIYCSTLPEFGFGPLSSNATVVQVAQKLDCRPCGLHGKKECPQQHFNCANLIKVEQLYLL